MVRQHGDELILDLVRQLNTAYGVYQGKTFKHGAFQTWITKRTIPWIGGWLANKVQIPWLTYCSEMVGPA